ncbi:MAG TPA: cation:proton antiporter [Brevundimonas sp.]|jgi:CPA2 family monovalent cation:H+ antiporter-2|uniref:cation:proton antiporter domain-containing protein n=1 Tax=Brevundimonas sp. TaxID=1871086 RepID=UPI002E11D31A|nr:cation:proton antiporter [Brevundimonas sp.]
MPGHGGEDYKDLLLFLAAAGVVAPLFSRLKLSPVLGFLAAGVLLGPHGLGRFADQAPWLAWLTITDREQVAVLSELGVAFLLFMIGLELSWERLKALRRLVFGFGLTQVVLCSLVLAGGFLLAGQSLGAAAVAGLALALSSTAVVMPTLAESGRLKSGVGRATFAVLLAQDVSVAPILITVAVIAAVVGAGAAAGPDAGAVGTALLSLVPAAIGLGLLVLLGRLVVRPLFRLVARADGSELFVAAAMLVVVGAGTAAQAAGLSMSLGALVAGLLLAETEYRRAVESHIEPFKGLLLGVFFVGVGIGLDLDAVAADPVTVFGLAALLTLTKAVLIAGLARAWGLGWRAALEIGLVLGPAGEFAFVILNTGLVEGLATPAFTQALMVSATLSLFSIPLLAAVGQRLAQRLPQRPTEEETAPGPEAEAEADEARTLIVGFGRVGRLVSELLSEHGQPWLAVDADAAAVTAARREGLPVVYGDAARPDLLRRLGVAGARALVITMDSPAKIDEVAAAARAARSDLILIARARDDRHAARLYAMGVTDAVPETTEASLQLAENTLVDLGVPMGLVLASIHERRDQYRQLFQAAAPEGRGDRPARALRSTRRNAPPAGR